MDFCADRASCHWQPMGFSLKRILEGEGGTTYRTDNCTPVLRVATLHEIGSVRSKSPCVSYHSSESSEVMSSLFVCFYPSVQPCNQFFCLPLTSLLTSLLSSSTSSQK